MSHRGSFWGRYVICPVSDGGHHGKGEHDQRHMAVPAMPGAGFVVIEPQLVLGGLKAVFNRPAMPFNRHETLDSCARRAPCREERHVAVSNVATDQQSAGPKP